jgi:hypothetical protein
MHASNWLSPEAGDGLPPIFFPQEAEDGLIPILEGERLRSRKNHEYWNEIVSISANGKRTSARCSNDDENVLAARAWVISSPP